MNCFLLIWFEDFVLAICQFSSSHFPLAFWCFLKPKWHYPLSTWGCCHQEWGGTEKSLYTKQRYIRQLKRKKEKWSTSSAPIHPFCAEPCWRYICSDVLPVQMSTAGKVRSERGQFRLWSVPLGLGFFPDIGILRMTILTTSSTCFALSIIIALKTSF